jgi:hypothetical protein
MSPGPAPARKLPPLYFLRNFRLALQSLQERYAELLSDAEVGFIRQFGALPEASQCLLTRMLMRKGPEFRRSTLCYAEVPDLAASLRHLADLCWLEADPLLSADDLLRLLHRVEWHDTFGFRSRAKAGPQGDAQLALPWEEQPPAPRPLSLWNRRLRDGFVRLTVEPLAKRLQWLFFGNDHQDWAEFVLTDLGQQRYERVPFDASSRAFQSREQIEHFHRLNECRARLRAGEAAASLLEQVEVPAGLPDWLAARFVRLHVRLGEMLEREGAATLALRTYRAAAAPEALIRAVRLQERQGLHGDAWNDALAVRDSSCTEGQREAVERALTRLGRRLGAEAVARAPRARVEHLELTLAPLAEGERVESRVAAQLSAGECPAFHVENSLLTSLFGLLCWEAVFAPLPGAFFHPFQSGPADLHTAEFRSRRAARFDALLGLLDSGEHEAVIRRHYRDKAGINSAFVRWGRLTPQVLSFALRCVPPAHLRLLFERLLQDARENATGLPDLIQFWPEERRYRLIEVKAPGDRLQDNQRRWMTFFAAHQIPAAVCKVRWADASG